MELIWQAISATPMHQLFAASNGPEGPMKYILLVFLLASCADQATLSTESHQHGITGSMLLTSRPMGSSYAGQIDIPEPRAEWATQCPSVVDTNQDLVSIEGLTIIDPPALTYLLTQDDLRDHMGRWSDSNILEYIRVPMVYTDGQLIRTDVVSTEPGPLAFGVGYLPADAPESVEVQWVATMTFEVTCER